MDFKPYYRYGYEINLQDLSQRVRLFKDNFPEFSIELYESHIAILNLHSPIIKSTKEAVKDLIALKSKDEFNRNFETLSVTEGQKEGLSFFKNKLAQSKDSKDQFSIDLSTATGLVFFENPSWPLNYFYANRERNSEFFKFDEAKLADKENQVRYSEVNSSKYEISDYCLNFLTPIKIDKSWPSFDYFFLLKALFMRDHHVDDLEAFLDYHLRNEFNGNLREFSLFLFKAFANQLNIQPAQHINQYFRDWIDYKIKSQRVDKTDGTEVVLQSKYKKEVIEILLPFVKSDKKSFINLMNGQAIIEPIIFDAPIKTLTLSIKALNLAGIFLSPDVVGFICANFQVTTKGGLPKKIAADLVTTYLKGTEKKGIKYHTLKIPALRIFMKQFNESKPSKN